MGVSLLIETTLWNAGARVIAGMDEVGRGALAGPVSVGVVAVEPCAAWPEGLADSKDLTPKRRQSIAAALAGFGLARAIGSASNSEVDERGIVGALRLAGWRALGILADAGVEVDALLLDGHHDWLTPPPSDLFDSSVSVPRVPPVRTIVKGDATCVSIAAASVLAKVGRDAVMVEGHHRHPEYGWIRNKGYGTPDHLKALALLGPTPWHRTSWKLPRQQTLEAFIDRCPQGRP